MLRKLGIPLAVILLAGGCVGSGEELAFSSGDGKEDSGWLSNVSFEVDAVVRGTVQVESSYEWEGLADDPALQMHLIDLQVKYAKNETEARGYRINQLVDSVDSVAVTVEGSLVTLVYEATVDMVAEHRGDVPSLEELQERVLVARVPLRPTDVYSRAGTACANDPSSVSGYNYHYYFDPAQPGCAIPLVDARIEIVEVFDRAVVYPEYDQLMRLREDGSVGFDAAIVPASGDSDPLSRFDAHRAVFEGALQLQGAESEDGSFVRYEWRSGNVAVLIDLYNPTEDHFTTTFQQALSTYDLLYYNGHSAYGTQRLLTEPEAFSDRYQIIGLHSCQSYAYYVQQAFRAKANAEDPEGEALTDFLATGRSSYPSDSADILEVLLRGLMDGLAAIDGGNPERAPDWLTIVSQMNNRVAGINYGMAGVRNNRWQPPDPE